MFPRCKIIPPEVTSALNDVDSKGVIVFDRFATGAVPRAQLSQRRLSYPEATSGNAIRSNFFCDSFNRCPMLFSTKKRIFPLRNKDSPERADINQNSYAEVVLSDANDSALRFPQMVGRREDYQHRSEI